MNSIEDVMKVGEKIKKENEEAKKQQEKETRTKTMDGSKPITNETNTRIINDGIKETENKEIEELRNKIYMLLVQKKRTQASEVVTQHLLAKNNIQSIRDDDHPEMWIYDDGIYVPNGKSYIEEQCRYIFQEAYTSHIKNDIINKILAETYIEQEAFFQQQEQYPTIIPVQNGLLDIVNKELKPFSPEIFFFNKLPVSYVPGRECPSIIRFLQDVLSTEKDLLTMQELFGYILHKEYCFETAFMLLGKGRNGKSKTIEIMKRFLGVENCANLSLNKIEEDSFSLCELQNKLVNISPDISKKALENTGNFKSLTGRDMIHASRKFKTMVKFENFAKMIFAANELPRTSDMTEAFFQRWERIDFPYTFYNSLDYESNKNNPLAKKGDPNILSKVLCKDELDGLLNWALEGYDRLMEKKIFSSAQTTDVIRENWIRESDSSRSFVSDMLVDDFDGFISWSMLKTVYKDYCRKNALTMRSDKDLRRSLLDDTLASSERRLLDDDRVRGYGGIAWRSKGDNQVTF